MSNPTTTSDIEARITEYLAAGGLFNPELMEHEKVRDLLLDCRAALAAERESRKDYQGEAYELNLKLAVERDYGNRLTVQLEEAQQQLDAEREAVEQYKVAFENANDTCSTLRKHLATAIEALKEIANSNEDNQYLSKVAEDALAKIGEK